MLRFKKKKTFLIIKDNTYALLRIIYRALLFSFLKFTCVAIVFQTLRLTVFPSPCFSFNKFFHNNMLYCSWFYGRIMS